jgi:hypothetical protein
LDFFLITAVAAVFHLARVMAVAQVALIFTRWTLSLHPFLVPPDISITQAAAPLSVLRPVLWGTGVGLLTLAPSFLYLFRVFKGGRAFTQTDEIHMRRPERISVNMLKRINTHQGGLTLSLGDMVLSLQSNDKMNSRSNTNYGWAWWPPFENGT